MQSLKESLLFYTKYLYLVDYMLILLVFFLFTFVLLLVVFLRDKPLIGLFIIAIDIIASFFIFIYGYDFIDNKVRTRQTNILNQRVINSTNSLSVDFNITNNSNKNFKICKVLAKIYKDPNSNENIIFQYKDKLMPIRQKSITLKNLKKQATQIQRISFENFTMENNYTVKLKSECF